MPKKKPAKRKIKQADKPADGMRIEFVSVAELLPYAANARIHDSVQIEQIKNSILEFGFTNPVLIDANNELVAGHGRVMAAKELGHDLVPCIRLGHLTELQIRAYRLADNKIALNSGWDDSLLKAEIEALQKLDVDLQIAGFGAGELDEILNGLVGDNDSPYTNKIIAPIYEPKGERPPVAALFNHTKTDELIAGIEAANLPDDVRHFMRLAAERHTAFNFRQIAEFYCHADKALQDLMERSGLVIIDFNKAIEYGFVHLTERLGQLADMEEAANEG